MTLENIKLVAFDLDDCLFDSTSLSERARIRGIEAMIDLGLDVEKSYGIKILQEIVKEYGSNSSKHYDYFLRRLIELEKKTIPIEDQYKYIAGAVMAYHGEKIESIKVFDDVIECLQSIREMHIQSAIITDGIPIKQYEKILRLGIHDLVDLVIISDEIGVRKPNPKLFAYCLKKFGVSGPETIYVGDRIDKDVIPAKLSNIHSVLILRGGKYDPQKTGKKIPKETQPDFLISSLSEIKEIIEEINQKKD